MESSCRACDFGLIFQNKMQQLEVAVKIESYSNAAI